METWGTPLPAPRPGVGASQVPRCRGFGNQSTHEETAIPLRAPLTNASHGRLARSAGSRMAQLCSSCSFSDVR